MQTQSFLLPQVTDLIKGSHSYSVPEVIALPIVGGSSDYLDWVRKSTKEKGKGKEDVPASSLIDNHDL